MGNELTTFSNILFVVTSLIGVGYFHYWLKTEALTDNTKTVLWAWIEKDAAVLLRIGWWIFALILAGKGETYHHWFIEHKHWISVPTSLMYVHGQVLFIHHIVGLSRWKRFSLMALTVLLAVTITVAGF